ncbi:MAG: acetylxylan esterase, partial [Pseudomonadales bacterium]|nr:acetylxylan esterase [Pseudomonadales bacterium]
MAAITVQVTPDHKNALYEIGESATIRVTVSDGDEVIRSGSIAYVVDNFLETITSAKGLEPGVNPTTIKLVSDKPQFLRCRVTYMPAAGKPTVVTVSVGFSVEQIQPGLSVPDDFDAFWSEQKALLARVEMKIESTPVPQPDVALECFDVQVT